MVLCQNAQCGKRDQEHGAQNDQCTVAGLIDLKVHNVQRADTQKHSPKKPQEGIFRKPLSQQESHRQQQGKTHHWQTPVFALGAGLFQGCQHIEVAQTDHAAEAVVADKDQAVPFLKTCTVAKNAGEDAERDHVAQRIDLDAEESLLFGSALFGTCHLAVQRITQERAAYQKQGREERTVYRLEYTHNGAQKTDVGKNYRVVVKADH